MEQLINYYLITIETRTSEVKLFSIRGTNGKSELISSLKVRTDY